VERAAPGGRAIDAVTAAPPRRSPAYWLFAALIALTIAIGIGAYAAIENSVNVVVDAYQARRAFGLMLLDVIDEETGARGYAVNGLAQFLEPYHLALARYPSDEANAVEAARGPGLLAVAGDIRAFHADYVAWHATFLLPFVARSNRAKGGSFELRGKALVDDMRARVAHATEIGNSAIAAAIARTRLAIVGSIAAIVVLTLVLGSAALNSERRRTIEERRLRALIAVRNDALESSNRSLEEFAYVASHDLQEPLRTVASFTQLLQKRYAGRLDSQADEYIAFAVDGALRMQQLIADILAYSRITTHAKPAAPVDLTAIVDRALANLQAAIAETRAEVVVERTLPTVPGDAAQLLQLFQNLLGNALKYHRSPSPRVTVNAVCEGDEWLFSVADNGIGIAPEYFERIFRIFTRLHTRAEYSGTGIGLALCRRIVERHGGRIWVESREGNGATFFFTLQAAEKGRG
jgi:signal transduction histidine kinase